MARCVEIEPVLTDLADIIPLIYHLGCIHKDPELSKESKMKLRTGVINRLLEGKLLKVDCTKGSKASTWVVTVNSGLGCPSHSGKDVADAATQCCTLREGALPKGLDESAALRYEMVLDTKSQTDIAGVNTEGATGGRAEDLIVLTDLFGQLDPSAQPMRLAHPGFAAIPDPPQCVRPKTKTRVQTGTRQQAKADMKRGHDMTFRPLQPMLPQNQSSMDYPRNVRLCVRPINYLKSIPVPMGDVLINPDMDDVELDSWTEWGSMCSHPLRLDGCHDERTYLPLAAWPLVIFKNPTLKLYHAPRMCGMPQLCELVPLDIHNSGENATRTIWVPKNCGPNTWFHQRLLRNFVERSHLANAFGYPTPYHLSYGASRFFLKLGLGDVKYHELYLGQCNRCGYWIIHWDGPSTHRC